jgi:hypothetical protein
MGSLMEPGLESFRDSRFLEIGDTIESVGLLYDCLHLERALVSCSCIRRTSGFFHLG